MSFLFEVVILNGVKDPRISSLSFVANRKLYSL